MQDDEPAAPSSSTCQVTGCGVNLNRLRPYFRRQRICEEHARAESVPDGRSGLARFCQQCTRLEPLSFFDGQRRSCRSSLAKRQERMSAARRRNQSGSDEPLSSSNSDGPEDGGEEVGGAGTRRAALRAAGNASPHSSVSPLRHKRSRSTSPPRQVAGPATLPLAAPAAASAPPARPLAATFPSAAAWLQPRASGEPEDSSAATAQLSLLLPSVLAGLLVPRPAAGSSMPLAAAAPPTATGLISASQSGDDATQFLASLAVANGSSRALPTLDGSAGNTVAAVAAAVAAAAAPRPGSAGLGPPPVPLPNDPHELRQMLSTLLQLQALVSSVIIPQVQQRLAAMELAALLGALGPQGMAAAAAAQPLLSTAQQPVAAQPQAASLQLAPGLMQLGLQGHASHAMPAAAQDAALAQLLGSLVSQQQEAQQRRQQQAQQPQRSVEQQAQRPEQQDEEGKQGEQAQQLPPQAREQQRHAELPASQLASVIQQLLGQ